MQEINNDTFLKLVFIDRGSFESLNCSESYHQVNTAINSNTQSEATMNVNQNWLTNDLCIPNLVYISQYWVKVLTCSQAVLNGIEFRTRHNDYELMQPHESDSSYGNVSLINFPQVSCKILFLKVLVSNSVATGNFSTQTV